MGKNCPICQGKWRLNFKVESNLIWQCQNCGLWRLQSNNKKFQNHHGYHHVMNLKQYNEVITKVRTQQYLQGLNKIKALTTGRKILDIGSSQGLFLSLAAKSGFNSIGIEPQNKLAQISRQNKYRLKVIHATIQYLNRWSQKFDVITLWSVFEHLTNPQEAIKLINLALKKGGILVIQTPDSHGWTHQIGLVIYGLSKGKIDTMFRSTFQLDFDSKHWFLFNRQNLRQLLCKSGFQVLKIESSTGLNWKNLSAWFKLRKIKVNPLIKLFFFVGLYLNNTIGHWLGKEDDQVIYARKL